MTILEVCAGEADNVMSTDAKKISVVFCIASPEWEERSVPFDLKQNVICRVQLYFLNRTRMTQNQGFRKS